MDEFMSNGDDVDDTLVFNDTIWAMLDFPYITNANSDTTVKML